MNQTDQLMVRDSVIGSIDRIDLIIVKLPLAMPFVTGSYTWTSREALLLKISAQGISGWGECTAATHPFYSPETMVTAAHIIKDFLLPQLECPVTIGEIENRFRSIRGHYMAKAAVENALLDLLAKLKGLPLHQWLGFQARRIMSGISIGMPETMHDLLVSVEKAVAKKYHRIKMKIKRGQDLEWVAAVRQHFPAIKLMVDANGAYQLEDSSHLQQFDGFNLMMIEQPLSPPDIYRHSILQRALKTPLCLDESIQTTDDAVAAVALGSCRIINIKQGRIGGLLESLRMAHYAATHGIGIWCGGMVETGIGRAVNIHLQTDTNFNFPGDTSETSRYFNEDIVEPAVVLDHDGFIEVPAGSGIGVKILPEILAKYTIHAEKIK
jgi:O-succinylbenzoate synthase